jgi:hypothetical protein
LPLLLSLSLVGQQATVFTQSIRGTVFDNILQTPLQGATVTLVGSGLSVITDVKGNFRFTGVSLTPQQITVSHAGYKKRFNKHIIVNTGKETVLTFLLEASVHTEKEIVIKANSKENKPLNEMSVVSARAFTVEETQKYAAAVNDPLQMATGFANREQLFFETVWKNV